MSNDERADAVETFLLQEAVGAGVVKEIKLTIPKNPNKWGKTLAPWFTETCREAKREMARARREHGKGDLRSSQATRAYLRTCQQARLEFSAQTPDMLKYQPTRFCGMFKGKNDVENCMTAEKFATFNQNLFYNE